MVFNITNSVQCGIYKKTTASPVFLDKTGLNWNFNTPTQTTYTTITTSLVPNWTTTIVGSSSVPRISKKTSTTFAANAALCPTDQYISVQTTTAITAVASTTMTTNITFPVSSVYTFYLSLSIRGGTQYNNTATSFSIIIDGVEQPSFIFPSAGFLSSTPWYSYSTTYQISTPGTYQVSLKIKNVGGGTVNDSTMCFTNLSISYIPEPI
jgi:hypothetical protein